MDGPLYGHLRALFPEIDSEGAFGLAGLGCESLGTVGLAFGLGGLGPLERRNHIFVPGRKNSTRNRLFFLTDVEFEF